MNTVPLVSIICITYNHEKFISQAIEGFLMQEASFPFEVIVHDDCSTDGTTNIVRSYQLKYPDIIKPIIQVTNQFSLGKRITPIALPFCRGKYIALCEGDDFWTYSHKLQEQIDFLEANPAYVMSFHDALIVHQNKNNREETFKERFKSLQYRSIFNHGDVVERWFMPTASIIFKNNLILKLPIWFDKVYSGDYTLQLLISQYGLIKFHDGVWCTHIKHDAGISQQSDLQLYRLNRRIYQFKKYIQYFDKKYKYQFTLKLLILLDEKLKIETNFLKRNLLLFERYYYILKLKYIYFQQRVSEQDI